MVAGGAGGVNGGAASAAALWGDRFPLSRRDGIGRGECGAQEGGVDGGAGGAPSGKTSLRTG